MEKASLVVENWLIKFIGRNNDIKEHSRIDLLNVNLFEEGFIDSMGVMKLVVELEKDFEIQFTANDFQDRRFTSIAGLKEMIVEKKQGL